MKALMSTDFLLCFGGWYDSSKVNLDTNKTLEQSQDVCCVDLIDYVDDPNECWNRAQEM
jgi:hypothetical protein